VNSEDEMNDKSLDEIVRQLEGESRPGTRLESVASSPLDQTAAVDDVVEGLRATEWLLSDLRDRCRQLHGYRLRLIDQLQQLEDGEFDGEFEELLDLVVPGPTGMQ
jgi:hypothetical protein